MWKYIVLIILLSSGAAYLLGLIREQNEKRKLLEIEKQKKAIENKYLAWRDHLKNKITTNTRTLRILPNGEHLTGTIDYFDVTHKKFHFSADDTTLKPSFVQEETLYPPNL